MRNLIGLMLLIIVLSSCQQAKPQAQGKAEVIWKPYSKQALVDSINQKKPVVIDFFADWCPNCHELDRTVFSDPAIAAKLASVTTLRMDVSNMDDARVQQIAQDYGVDGVPTVIFLDRRGHEIADSRIIGLVSPKEFFQSLALLKIFK